jgi:hypothetical protein
MKVTWKSTKREEVWRSELIALRADKLDSNRSSYSATFQTMTPALTVIVYHADDIGDFAGWVISVSAYGHINTRRQS